MYKGPSRSSPLRSTFHIFEPSTPRTDLWSPSIRPVSNMQQTLLLAILLGVAISAPTPQLMNKDAISAPLDTILVSLPLDVTQNIPAAIPSTPIPPITVSNTKRDAIHNEKRNGTCVPQPSGSGNITSPDTAEAFSENPIYGVRSPAILLLTYSLTDTLVSN